MELNRKNAFLVYHSYKKILKNLSNEKIGQLFIAMLNYSEKGIMPEFDPELQMAFNFISNDIDFNKEKYEKTCQKNKENAQKRWDEKREKRYGRIRSHAVDADSDSDSDSDSEREREEEQLLSLIKLITKRSISRIPTKAYAQVRKVHDFSKIVKSILAISFDSELQWFGKPMQEVFKNGKFTLDLLFAKEDKKGNEIDRVEEFSSVKLKFNDELKLSDWVMQNANFFKSSPLFNFLNKFYE